MDRFASAGLHLWAACCYRLSFTARQLQEVVFGLFLGTAHPATFKENVEDILGKTLALPDALAQRADLELLSHNFAPDFAQLREFLMALPE